MRVFIREAQGAVFNTDRPAVNPFRIERKVELLASRSVCARNATTGAAGTPRPTARVAIGGFQSRGAVRLRLSPLTGVGREAYVV